MPGAAASAVACMPWLERGRVRDVRMIDLVLLAELRQLYDLQLQAAHQDEWQIKRQLNALCMFILKEIAPDAIDALYGFSVPESCSPLPGESSEAVPCA